MLSRFSLVQSASQFARAISTAGVGLFSKAELQQPTDWVKYAQDTVHR